MTSKPEEFVARDGSLMRLIPEGVAIFGSTREEIRAAARLDRDGPLFPLENETPQFKTFVSPYYLGVYAVTNRQFARFLSETRTPAPLLNMLIPWRQTIQVPEADTLAYTVASGFEEHPVANVSWYGAEAYCSWAGLRLPTELEWEKGARGTDGRVFPWGNDWSPERLCWHGSHSAQLETIAVTGFKNGCSPYGLYQMAGNVEEWCADWYDPHAYWAYTEGNSKAPRHGFERVLRGGNCRRRNKLEFRCAMRRGNRPAFVNTILTGIRCAHGPDLD
jgi:formylglycine-generating enzyme required for sulfatase activity